MIAKSKERLAIACQAEHVNMTSRHENEPSFHVKPKVDLVDITCSLLWPLQVTRILREAPFVRITPFLTFKDVGGTVRTLSSYW